MLPSPPPLLPVSGQILCKVRSEISQEVTGEMAPYSEAKLALLRRHDKAHMVLIPTNVTLDFKPKNETECIFKHLCPNQKRVWVHARGCNVIKRDSECFSY